MLKITDLPKSTQEELERITGLQPFELSEADKRFLRGRRDYLTPAMVKEYKEILDAPNEEPKKE